MERLIASQRELYGRIARTHENLRKLGTANLSVSVVQAAIKVLEAKWEKFNAQHDRITSEFEDECDKTSYISEDVVSTVEYAYIEQMARLRDLEKTFGTQPDADVSTVSARAEHATTRNVLPRIQLPQFSGKFEDWPAFRDLFSSIVIEENTLAKVEKLHYLKTSVKGDAEKLIRNLPATADNFERAWAALTSHFENKRLLVRSYLTAFTSLTRMKTDSVADLRRIFHGVISVVGALEGIERPISNGTDLFVHTAVELLDTKTRREWENSLGKSSEPPTYEDLRDFLEEQLLTQEVLRVAKGESAGDDKPGRSARSNHARGRGADSSRSCPLCSRDHFMAGCEQYRRKSALERREAVTANRRCWNCLGRHMIGECSSSKTCTQCAGRHHSSLHDAFVTVALADALDSSSRPCTSRTVRCQDALPSCSRPRE